MPSLETIFVYDLICERAQALSAKMNASLCPKTQVQAVGDPSVSQICDIVVTATGSPRPVVNIADFGKGCLCIHFGGFECSFVTVSGTDRRFIDSWQAVKHRNASAIAKMANKGILSETLIDGELEEVVAGKNQGRTGGDEIIYFSCAGMGIEDVAIATRIYRRALETHTGTKLRYW